MQIRQEILDKAKDLLKAEVTQIAFQTWFSSMDIVEMTDSNIVLKANSQYIANEKEGGKTFFKSSSTPLEGGAGESKNTNQKMNSLFRSVRN